MENETLAFDFGLRIKQLRESNGWSQEKLGDRLGVDRQSVYRYEANLQLPPFEKAKRLAEIFRVSLDYLVGWENEPVLRLHNLTAAQTEALLHFIEAFVPDSLG